MTTLFFEDLEIGRRYETAGVTLTEAQSIDFALTYDPQPIHIDAVAAKDGPFGGLIASGWQTAALTFRLFIQMGLFADSGMGGAGVDELRWHKPVRPGDTLRATAEIVALRPSSRVNDRGYAEIAYTARNQHGETVLTMRARHLVALRQPAVPTP